ncbi:hypothetical protein GGR57DRAFT_463469 [Xylariaceae sp. FL1272]|nr:hypothetical protein GGR57DRAFT_463469 [Xylariaceae sp. FL1272]
MVLSALSSTYQLYKQDTDSVAAWLASTAKSLGFSDDLDGESGPSRRLKGKARTKGKKQAAKSKPTPSSASPKYVIHIKDFVPLAEYIAGKSESVPASFRQTISRVIAARSGFGDKLEKHGKPVTELSDAKHQYFIEVLEKVRSILLPFMPVDTGDSKTSTEEWLSNRFSRLAVFEPSQEFLDAPNIERPQKAQNDSATYEVEAQDSFEDAMFALGVVIDDMNRVRTRINWIWANYKIGIFDLAAASIATNTAIDLVRNIMEDILPAIEKHGGLHFMLEKFFFAQCLMRGLKKDEITTVGMQDNLNYNTYDIGEGTYFIAFRQVEAFLNVLQPGQIPLYKEGMFGYYDPMSDRSRKSGQQKFEDDRALLMPFFTQLITAVRGVQDWPVKDEFTRGMEELDKTKKVPFYMVFAAQIFLDVTYELREDIEEPSSILINHTTAMDDDIKSHFEFHEKLKIKNWPARNDHWLRDLQRSIQWIGKDPLRSIQRKIIQRSGFDIPDPQSHRLFRMSPVISGLFLYHFRSRYHEVGFAVADAWGSIQYCSHLYNALRQEKMFLSGHRWIDMDVVTTNVGNESFYVGGEAPKTPEEYFSKFCMQMGTSLAAMTRAKGRRKNTSLESKAGPRGLKVASPVLSMFRARYVENSGQVDFTPEHVNQIINLSLFEEETNEDGSFVLGQIEDPEKLKEKKKLQKSKKHKAFESGNMPLEQLIRPLALALHAESLEFAFPYLHFHRWCWRVLRSVKDACDSLLRQLYTPEYLENECQLPWVVGWIFMAASGLEAGISDRRPLQKAAEAMEVFLATGSSSFITKDVLAAKLGMSLEFEAYGSSDGE